MMSYGSSETISHDDALDLIWYLMLQSMIYGSLETISYDVTLDLAGFLKMQPSIAYELCFMVVLMLIMAIWCSLLVLLCYCWLMHNSLSLSG
ncbi:hypothetical protein Hanom_Chr02g00121131 [Helianthus anomalus]